MVSVHGRHWFKKYVTNMVMKYGTRRTCIACDRRVVVGHNKQGVSLAHLPPIRIEMMIDWCHERYTNSIPEGLSTKLSHQYRINSSSVFLCSKQPIGFRRIVAPFLAVVFERSFITCQLGLLLPIIPLYHYILVIKSMEVNCLLVIACWAAFDFILAQSSPHYELIVKIFSYRFSRNLFEAL